MDYTFHWRPVFRKWPDLLEAGLLTMEVAMLALLFGIVIGLLLALVRMSERKTITWFAVTWIEIARNTESGHSEGSRGMSVNDPERTFEALGTRFYSSASFD